MSSLRSLCFIGYIYLISFSSYNTKVTYLIRWCVMTIIVAIKNKKTMVKSHHLFDEINIYLCIYLFFFWTNKREKAIKNLLIPTCSLGCSLPVAHPFICRKNLLLKTKLFSVRINVSSVVMTIVAMLLFALYWGFLWLLLCLLHLEYWV